MSSSSADRTAAAAITTDPRVVIFLIVVALLSPGGVSLPTAGAQSQNTAGELSAAGQQPEVLDAGIHTSARTLRWVATDVDTALAAAAAEDAPVLVLFIAADSPLRTRLLRDFATDFLAQLPPGLLLARVSVPAADSADDAEAAAAQRERLRQLSILELPTAIVFDSSGREIDRAVGYEDPDTWLLNILRAASGTDPLPAYLARARRDLHDTYEAGWRLLVRGETDEGESLLRAVYNGDDRNVYGHTADALRMLARHAEEIRDKPRTALTYWKILLDARYDRRSRAEALSALVRIYSRLGEPEEGLEHLINEAEGNLDDLAHLEDLTAYAERIGFGTLEAAAVLRRSLQMSPRGETAGLLIRLLLSEDRVWEAGEQIHAWRQAGWRGPAIDSLEQRVSEASRQEARTWDAVYDTPPQVAEQEPPECPESATLIGAAGKVVVRAIVGPEGTVLDASVHSSSEVTALDEAAVEAVSSWRFRPAKRGGDPVAAEVLIPVRFDCQ